MNIIGVKMTFRNWLAGTAFVLAASVLTASAAPPIRPALVYAMGGKFDKSFSEGLYRGAEKFKAETKINYVDFEISNETQFEQAYRRFAQHGMDPIIGVSFSQADAVTKVAKDFPHTHFTLIDGDVKLPNVQSVEFHEEEGSFLVGMLAALASKTHKVGFVGGMDIPLIRKFSCGYAQGIKYADPKAVYIQNMTGTTPESWTNPARGGELAKGQFDRGVDVVFAAAGLTGLGVLQAAQDNHKLAIGVDSNQDYLHPGTMLTSMVKRVDVVVYNALKASAAGTWKPGHSVLGLKDQGVDYAYDQYNAKLITPEMKAKVDQAKADIVAGKIKVHDYESNNSCNI
jgi:basic membrane protein A and related proteins